MFRKAALTLAILAAGSLSLAAQTGNHVQTPSVWTVDLAASDFGGDAPPKSQMLYMATDTDEWLAWKQVTVDDQGKTDTESWSGVPDGTLRAVTGSKSMASYQKNGDAHWVTPSGGTVDCLFSLSPDRKKATVDGIYRSKSGKESRFKTVYVRADTK